MLPQITEFLKYSDEPVVLARGGRIVRLNGSAEELLGRGCEGRSVSQVFGEEIAGTQAPSFVAGATVQGRLRTVRAFRMEGMQLFFLSRDDRDLAVMNDASLAALRSSLMNLGLGAERGRQRAEELGDEALGDCFASISKQYFLLRRIIANSGVVYSALRGELPLTLATVDLAELCRSTAETVSLLRPGAELRVSAPATLLLHADGRLIETMLLNLLSNCLLHAKGLGLVSISLSETEQSAVLSVSDDGCGIPADRLHAVFNRYRCGFELSSQPLGAGLGLSVVRAVAARHGGTLLLESREGQGTSVRVSLSRKLGGNPALRGEPELSRCGIDALLTGLADCLPDRCFDTKYLD